MALLDHEDGAEFPYERDDVFDAVVKVIPTISGMKVDSADQLTGHILAKAGMSLFSWGEIIPISVNEIRSGRTRVSVTSTPKTGVMFGGAFDMGKNRRNIEQILAAASQLLSRTPPVKTKPETSGPADLESRLVTLRRLLDSGLITRDDFDRRKEVILSDT